MPAFILGGSVWHIFPVKKWKKNITKQRKVSPLTWWQYQLALGSTELQQGEGLLPKYTEKQWPTETSIDLSPYQYKIPPEIHSILTLSKDRIRFFFLIFKVVQGVLIRLGETVCHIPDSFSLKQNFSREQLWLHVQCKPNRISIESRCPSKVMVDLGKQLLVRSSTCCACVKTGFQISALM